jgi:hypothetical protein
VALIKEIWIGPERGYVCALTRAVFAEGEHGGREAARRAALHHCYKIIREQTANGVPRRAPVKERRRIYKKSLVG